MKKLLLIAAAALLAVTASANATTKTRLCLGSPSTSAFTDHGADTSVYFPEFNQTQNFYANDTSAWYGQGDDGFVTTSQHDACGNKAIYFYTGDTPDHYFYGPIHLNPNVANNGPKCTGSLDTTGTGYQVGYTVSNWPADTNWEIDRAAAAGTTSDPQIVVLIWRSSGTAFPAYNTWAFNLRCNSDSSAE
jgi:hypothetical protein